MSVYQRQSMNPAPPISALPVDHPDLKLWRQYCEFYNTDGPSNPNTGPVVPQTASNARPSGGGGSGFSLPNLLRRQNAGVAPSAPMSSNAMYDAGYHGTGSAPARHVAAPNRVLFPPGDGQATTAGLQHLNSNLLPGQVNRFRSASQQQQPPQQQQQQQQYQQQQQQHEQQPQPQQSQQQQPQRLLQQQLLQKQPLQQPHYTRPTIAALHQVVSPPANGQAPSAGLQHWNGNTHLNHTSGFPVASRQQHSQYDVQAPAAAPVMKMLSPPGNVQAAAGGFPQTNGNLPSGQANTHHAAVGRNVQMGATSAVAGPVHTSAMAAVQDTNLHRAATIGHGFGSGPLKFPANGVPQPPQAPDLVVLSRLGPNYSAAQPTSESIRGTGYHRGNDALTFNGPGQHPAPDMVTNPGAGRTTDDTSNQQLPVDRRQIVLQSEPLIYPLALTGLRPNLPTRPASARTYCESRNTHGLPIEDAWQTDSYSNLYQNLSSGRTSAQIMAGVAPNTGNVLAPIVETNHRRLSQQAMPSKMESEFGKPYRADDRQAYRGFQDMSGPREESAVEVNAHLALKSQDKETSGHHLGAEHVREAQQLHRHERSVPLNSHQGDQVENNPHSSQQQNHGDLYQADRAKATPTNSARESVKRTVAMRGPGKRLAHGPASAQPQENVPPPQMDQAERLRHDREKALSHNKEGPLSGSDQPLIHHTSAAVSGPPAHALHSTGNPESSMTMQDAARNPPIRTENGKLAGTFPRTHVSVGTQQKPHTLHNGVHGTMPSGIVPADGKRRTRLPQPVLHGTGVKRTPSTRP